MSQQLSFEITSKENKGKGLGHVLYTPIKTAGSDGIEFSFTQANLYTINFTGAAQAVDSFAHTVLLDEVTQSVTAVSSIDDLVAPQGTLFYLEYAMRPDALDLEQQAILNYYKGSDKAFELESLKLTHRIFVSANSTSVDKSVIKHVAKRVESELCNSAVHTSQIHFI